MQPKYALDSSPLPSRGVVLAAVASIWLIWGSTYLAIHQAVQTLPPLTLAGVRYAVAGLVLYAYARLRGAPAPTARQWLHATVVGGLLVAAAGGLVTWAQASVPSGAAALVMATASPWMVVLAWLRTGRRPGAVPLFSALAGVVGAAVLAGPGALDGDGLGYAALVAASLSWAIGSTFGRTTDLPTAPLMSPAVQMATAGGLLMVVSGALGEWQAVDLATVTASSLAGWAYLVVFGSCVAYSLYSWLLPRAPLSLVSTHIFVNPLVAVILGALVLGETLDARVAVAAVLTIGSVILSLRPQLARGRPGSGVASSSMRPEVRNEVMRRLVAMSRDPSAEVPTRRRPSTTTAAPSWTRASSTSTARSSKRRTWPSPRAFRARWRAAPTPTSPSAASRRACACSTWPGTGPSARSPRRLLAP